MTEAPGVPITGLPGLRSGPPAWNAADRVWLVTRHADVLALLRAPGLGVADIRQGVERLGNRGGRDYSSLVNLLGATLFFCNPPFHTRARRFVSAGIAMVRSAFTEEALRPLARSAAASALAKGSIEAVGELCLSLPLDAVQAALGFSGETGLAIAKGAKRITDASHGAVPLRVLDELERSARRIEELVSRDLEAARADKASGLFALSALNDGEFQFPDRVLVALTFFLIWASVETTASLLASALFLFAGHPDQTALVRAKPRLMENAVEEVLRLASPAKRTSPKILSQDLLLGGVELPAGARVMAHLAQAQRDPEVYADPERFDVRRAGVQSIGFGFGAHACLGTAIAKREARIFLSEMIKAADFRIEDSAAHWEDHPDYIHLKRLHLACTPVSTREP